MSKYAPAGLNNMANIVLQDLAAKGEKSYLLVLQIALKTGLDTQDIVNRIVRLSIS